MRYSTPPNSHAETLEGQTLFKNNLKESYSCDAAVEEAIVASARIKKDDESLVI